MIKVHSIDEPTTLTSAQPNISSQVFLAIWFKNLERRKRVPPLNESQTNSEESLGKVHAAESERPVESKLQEQKQSQSPEQREADGHTLCRDLDPFHQLRQSFTELGFQKGEYSGIPIPLEGIGLVVEPTYKFAHLFNNFREEKHKEKANPENEGIVIRNSFYSTRKKCDISIVQLPSGKIEYRYRPAVHSLSQTLGTLFASDVWGIDQEQRALQTLGGMLRHRMFKQYLLTGMFLERSQRSGVTYIFRRLRPTIAISTQDPTSDDECKILCALCMHPIAYYEGSWAGAMCPTDDVIAHLSLMRGDEPMFWKRCNQHQPHRPEAGL